MTEGQVQILDPLDKIRPEKDEEQFRNFTVNNKLHASDLVKQTYYQMHTNQSYSFAKNKRDHWGQFNHAKMSIMEALEAVNELVDETKPNLDLANFGHAFEAAEHIRNVHPDKDWLQLVGLIHDLGKVMALHGEPQWAVNGDIFPVGCKFSDKIVFGRDSFNDNEDLNHPVYSTKLGVYNENCGLENVVMSWGHGDYLYRVLVHNKSKLPDEALYIVRFHHFSSWYTEGEYNYLCNNRDQEMLAWVKEFNKFDLYSKADSVPDPEKLRPYYQALIDKYIPGKLEW